MDNWQWHPGDPKMVGVLTEYDPQSGAPGANAKLPPYRPPAGRSFRGERPHRRHHGIRTDCLLNEGPYARSPAYVLRMLLSSGPEPLHVGPSALDIYRGSLPFRSKEAVEGDGPTDAGLTSARACLRFLYFSGYIDSHFWFTTMDDMLRWLVNGSGPLCVEMPVYYDFTYDDGVWLELEGPIIGRDCFLLTSYMYGTDYVRFTSAYGRGWGPDNHKRMRLDTFQRLCTEHLVIACGIVGKHAGVTAADLRWEREEDMELVLSTCVGDTPISSMLELGLGENQDGYYQDNQADTRWPEIGPDEADWELSDDN